MSLARVTPLNKNYDNCSIRSPDKGFIHFESYLNVLKNFDNLPFLSTTLDCKMVM